MRTKWRREEEKGGEEGRGGGGEKVDGGEEGKGEEYEKRGRRGRRGREKVMEEKEEEVLQGYQDVRHAAVALGGGRLGCKSSAMLAGRTHACHPPFCRGALLYTHTHTCIHTNMHTHTVRHERVCERSHEHR